MKLKSGVDPQGVHTKVWEALWVIDRIYAEHGEELVVTSLRDGKHKYRSEHYKGGAADLRTRYFTKAVQEIVAKKIQEALGEDYVVILEGNHMHMHWAPVYRGG